MVVLNHVAFLKQELSSGKLGTAHCSFNAHTGCEKVKIILQREASLSSQSSHAIASVLDYVISACDTHDKSVTDRGHRHSCGSIEVSFYIRKRLPDVDPPDVAVSDASQRAPDEKDPICVDIENLCAILDANIEQEVQRLSQVRLQFADHSEMLDRLALEAPPDIGEQSAHIKQLVNKCEECFQAQEERINNLREIRGRAAQGVLSTDRCVQEMQAMRNPIVELAAIWHPP